MTRALIFDTPEPLDLRALTVMGLSAKPNAGGTPIGRFGTGLKYAVAVCVRLEAAPTLWVNSARYRFRLAPTEFRGAAVDLLQLEEVRYAFAPNPTRDLPFTTAYGRDWEPWQAYRELEANTLDEGGRTWIADDADAVGAPPGGTRLVVPGETLAAVHEARDTVFLPGALTAYSYDSSHVQVFDAPSAHLYYRGLRVADLPKPARFTYNLLSNHWLTEDRTLKYDWEARDTVARYWAGVADQEAIARVLRAAPDAWEHGLEFGTGLPAPTPAFVAASAGLPGHAPALAYVARHEPARAPAVPEVFARHPRPWAPHTDRYSTAIRDATGNPVLLPFGAALAVDCSTDDDAQTEALLALVCAAVNTYEP